MTEDVLEQTLSKGAYDDIKNVCALRVVSLTKECKDLLKRIADCPPALLSLRRLFINYAGFPDSHNLDPYLHNDYEFIRDTVFYLQVFFCSVIHLIFLILIFIFLAWGCVKPHKPSLSKHERTHCCYLNLFPHHQLSFLQLQDLIELKW